MNVRSGEREADATEREEKPHSPKSALRSSERKERFVRNPPQSEEWLNEVGLTSLRGHIVKEMSVAVWPLQTDKVPWEFKVS